MTVGFFAFGWKWMEIALKGEIFFGIKNKNEQFSMKFTGKQRSDCLVWLKD
jgi:hypothetical protein